MVDFDRADIPAIQRFIELLADRAHVLSLQAGVGGMETAGGVISYLANHPEDIEPFMHGGFNELPVIPARKGCLTWHAQSGEVVTPEYAERKRIAKMLGAE